jgi:hypothetical protein
MNLKKRPSKNPVPDLHFNAQHEAPSHFAEANGLRRYYETHGRAGRRYYCTAARSRKCPRLWQPDQAIASGRSIGIIETVVYPFRGDTAGVQWSWPRVLAQRRLPADRRGVHWEALPGWYPGIPVVCVDE